MIKLPTAVLPIEFDENSLTEFCTRWNVEQLAMFGSVLRDDFGPDSDIDILVTFAPEARTSLFDLVQMHEELEAIFGRQVDILTKPGVERSRNAARRDAILSSAQVVYDTRS